MPEQATATRVYKGTRRRIEKRFAKDAEKMANDGYTVMSQNYTKAGCLEGCLGSVFDPFRLNGPDRMQVIYRRVESAMQ